MEEFFTIMISKPDYAAPSVPVAYALNRLWSGLAYSKNMVDVPVTRRHVVAADGLAKFARVGHYQWVAHIRDYTEDVMEFEQRMEALGWDVYVA
jgi:hypothetical protein